MKKILACIASVGAGALAFAQETGTTLDLTDYMDNLQSATESQVETLLPLLGDIAVIGIVLFLALWAFRMLKRFLSGR